jgi:hypothetical protein
LSAWPIESSAVETWSVTVLLTWSTWVSRVDSNVVAWPVAARTSSSCPSCATVPSVSTDVEELTPCCALAVSAPTSSLTSGLASIGSRVNDCGFMPSVALTVLLSSSAFGSASTSDPLASEDTAVDEVLAPVLSVLWTASPVTPMRLRARSFGMPGSAGRADGR